MDEEYDEIEQLIDNDPIELGRRLRVALRRLEVAESKLRAVHLYTNVGAPAFEDGVL